MFYLIRNDDFRCKGDTPTFVPVDFPSRAPNVNPLFLRFVVQPSLPVQGELVLYSSSASGHPPQQCTSLSSNVIIPVRLNARTYVPSRRQQWEVIDTEMDSSSYSTSIEERLHSRHSEAGESVKKGHIFSSRRRNNCRVQSETRSGNSAITPQLNESYSFAHVSL